MSGLDVIRGSWLWYVLCLAALLLILGQLGVLLAAFRCAYRRTLAVLNLLLGLALLGLLMDCAMAQIASSADRLLLFRPLQWRLFALPWGLCAIGELLSALLLLHAARGLRRYRRSHLTPDAIREAVNLLPDGLCISAPDGTVLLSNLKINALCRALTGGSLADAGRFVRALRERGEAQGDSILVRTEEGAVWLFTQKQLTTGGKRYNQLTAVDVTERYRIIDELREKNGRLQDIQRRMRAVSDWSADMFVAREEAAARAALHNQLGQVLLMGRHCLQHPESTEAAIVYMTTAQMNAFLLGEAEEPEPRQADALQNALLLAQSIGVTVTLRGAPPEDAARRELLALAIRECAANAVKHAEADALDMTISPCHPERSAAEAKDLTVTIVNNGLPPKGPIAESGGLLALRRHVEAAGGGMEVQSAPTFRLTLTLP